MRFELDSYLGILHVKPVAGFVSLICNTCECQRLWQGKWAHHTKSVKMILKAASTFKGERLMKWIACVSTAASSPAIKETLYISAHYNWALMIEDWMRPPVSSEMEIWEVSNAMREIYGSYLKLIDAFGLHRGSVCIGMFCVSVGAEDHAANQWVLGLLLKIEKRNNNSHNVGTEREGRSGIKHGMWVITDIKLNNHIL